MNRVEPAKRFALASQVLAALALLWGAGAAVACAAPSSDAARSPPHPAPAQTPDAAATGTHAPAGQDGGTTRAPAGQDGVTARIRRDVKRLQHSFLADKIALQKQLLATLEDCPGAHCPDPKLAAPATRTCARRCVTHWADCMGPCTVDQQSCEQHCTARKRACEDACRPGTPP